MSKGDGIEAVNYGDFDIYRSSDGAEFRTLQDAVVHENELMNSYDFVMSMPHISVRRGGMTYAEVFNRTTPVPDAYRDLFDGPDWSDMGGQDG
jgi:hypothetical protein